MTSIRIRTLTICTAVLALACIAGSVARPAVAASKPPCWQVLLNDWYDGRIDGTYPLHCYRDALKHLPSDVDTYSSARDDIERALQSARIAARKARTKLGSGTLIKPAGPGTTTTTGTQGGGTNGGAKNGGTGHGGAKNGGAKNGGAKNGGGTKNVVTIASPGRKHPGGIPSVADTGGNASSLPLPLLILGGLAILLVAAGAAGLGWRHYQGRKPAS